MITITTCKEDSRLKTQDARFRILVFYIFLLALLIPLLFNNAAYGGEDYSRRKMSQLANTALDEILSGKEFRAEEPKPSWLAKLMERLFSLLPEEIGWLGTAFRWLFYIFVVIATVAGLIFATKRFGKLPSFTTNRDDSVEIQNDIDAEAVKMQAYECSKEGNYRLAIRYLYLSLLLYLDKAGLLTYDMSKTNAEYISEAHNSMGNESESFSSLTLFFERKWYGMEKSSLGDFRQCEETFVRLTGSD